MTTEEDKEEYQIQLTPLALEMLAEVKDQRHLKIISDRIEKLKFSPSQQGKPLTDKLKGYRSVRAVAQRYRIIYKVELSKIIVVVVGVGLRAEGSRQDIYALIEKRQEE